MRVIYLVFLAFLAGLAQSSQAQQAATGAKVQARSAITPDTCEPKKARCEFTINMTFSAGASASLSKCTATMAIGVIMNPKRLNRTRPATIAWKLDPARIPNPFGNGPIRFQFAHDDSVSPPIRGIAFNITGYDNDEDFDFDEPNYERDPDSKPKEHIYKWRSVNSRFKALAYNIYVEMLIPGPTANPQPPPTKVSCVAVDPIIINRGDDQP